MSDPKNPENLPDAELDMRGGVYIQEIPSGIRPTRASVMGKGSLPGVEEPGADWAVFESNGED